MVIQFDGRLGPFLRNLLRERVFDHNSNIARIDIERIYLRLVIKNFLLDQRLERFAQRIAVRRIPLLAALLDQAFARLHQIRIEDHRIADYSGDFVGHHLRLCGSAAAACNQAQQGRKGGKQKSGFHSKAFN